jgi:hypothetical protein
LQRGGDGFQTNIYICSDICWPKLEKSINQFFNPLPGPTRLWAPRSRSMNSSNQRYVVWWRKAEARLYSRQVHFSVILRATLSFLPYLGSDIWEFRSKHEPFWDSLNERSRFFPLTSGGLPQISRDEINMVNVELY